MVHDADQVPSWSDQQQASLHTEYSVETNEAVLDLGLLQQFQGSVDDKNNCQYVIFKPRRKKYSCTTLILANLISFPRSILLCHDEIRYDQIKVADVFDDELTFIFWVF